MSVVCAFSTYLPGLGLALGLAYLLTCSLSIITTEFNIYIYIALVSYAVGDFNTIFTSRAVCSIVIH